MGSHTNSRIRGQARRSQAIALTGLLCLIGIAFVVVLLILVQPNREHLPKPPERVRPEIQLDAIVREISVSTNTSFFSVFNVSHNNKLAAYSANPYSSGFEGVYVIDFQTGRELRMLPSLAVQCLTFSRNGNFLFTGHNYGQLRISRPV